MQPRRHSSQLTAHSSPEPASATTCGSQRPHWRTHIAAARSEVPAEKMASVSACRCSATSLRGVVGVVGGGSMRTEGWRGGSPGCSQRHQRRQSGSSSGARTAGSRLELPPLISAAPPAACSVQVPAQECADGGVAWLACLPAAPPAHLTAHGTARALPDLALPRPAPPLRAPGRRPHPAPPQSAALDGTPCASGAPACAETSEQAGAGHRRPWWVARAGGWLAPGTDVMRCPPAAAAEQAASATPPDPPTHKSPPTHPATAMPGSSLSTAAGLTSCPCISAASSMHSAASDGGAAPGRQAGVVAGGRWWQLRR